MKRILVVIALVGAPAAADPVEGNTLYSLCEAPADASPPPVCVAYIIGTFEGFVLGRYIMSLPNPDSVLNPCIPDSADNRQILDVATKYLAENPAERHNSARFLIMQSLTEAFPCN